MTGKKKSTSEQKNTFAQIKPEETEYGKQYRESIGATYDTPDPSIGWGASSAHQRIDENMGGPWGRVEAPEVTAALKYKQHSDVDQQAGQAYREDAMRRKEAKLGHQGAYANLMGSQIVQTGGTMKSESKETVPWGPAAIGAAGNILGGWLSRP